LQRKPLDSIVDVQRLKDRYPDDITSIWDDVISPFFYFQLLFFMYKQNFTV
jgi:hypothetical protein